MYLTITWPNFVFEVTLISHYMENPKELHWVATKRIMCYVKDIIEYDILSQRNSDNNYSGNLYNRSTQGFIGTWSCLMGFKK